MASSQPFRLALVAMPWPAFNRPSIQLGTLKSYISSRSDHQVQCCHPYLGLARLLGDELYQWLASEVWICEALYSCLLYPERAEQPLALIDQACAKAGRRFDINDTLGKLDSHLEQWLASQDWTGFDLVGFSICLNQLCASLLAMTRLHALHPQLPIVVGGSSATKAAAPALCEEFKARFVICGEGEQPLLQLCHSMQGKSPRLPATVYSASQGWGSDEGHGQLADLAALPAPDYDDYFVEMQSHFPAGFRPVLPLEFSRGCWWRKCAFCNLNKQWQGYRFKKAEQMKTELAGLRQRYGCLDFTFTDNALPVADSRKFFTDCARQRLDYRFFAEIRASQRGEELLALQRGGLKTIQVGIEALSTSLLSRMNKGLRVIDNLAMMRDAIQCGVELEGNLIVAFPGSTDQEVAETLENLKFAFCFRPLSVALFFLGAGSAVDCRPADFGVKARLVHPANRRLFPAETLARFPQLVHGYRGDRQQQLRRWQPVRDYVKKWQSYHDQRSLSLHDKALLTFRDGGSFLDIRQETMEGQVLRHRLKGASRAIYLSCLEINSVEGLTSRFPKISAENMSQFLSQMRAKRLIFQEGDEYLALAVHARR